MTKHTLNYYVRSPEARFLIRCIAVIGYAIIGIAWWVLYLVIDFIYQSIQEMIGALIVLLEFVSGLKYRLEDLHKTMTYSEILLNVIGIGIVAVLGLFSFYIFIVSIILICPSNM